MRSLEREQVPVENVREDQLKQAFDLVSKGATAKESVIEVVKWLAFHPDGVAEEAVDLLNPRMLTESDLQKTISKVGEAKQPPLQENGIKALGRTMNLVI